MARAREHSLLRLGGDAAARFPLPARPLQRGAHVILFSGHRKPEPDWNHGNSARDDRARIACRVELRIERLLEPTDGHSGDEPTRWLAETNAVHWHCARSEEH